MQTRKPLSHSMPQFPQKAEKGFVFGLGGFPKDMLPPSRPSGGLGSSPPPPTIPPTEALTVPVLGQEEGRTGCDIPESSLSSWASASANPHLTH